MTIKGDGIRLQPRDSKQEAKRKNGRHAVNVVLEMDDGQTTEVIPMAPMEPNREYRIP